MKLIVVTVAALVFIAAWSPVDALDADDTVVPEVASHADIPRVHLPRHLKLTSTVEEENESALFRPQDPCAEACKKGPGDCDQCRKNVFQKNLVGENKDLRSSLAQTELGRAFHEKMIRERHFRHKLLRCGVLVSDWTVAAALHSFSSIATKVKEGGQIEGDPSEWTYIITNEVGVSAGMGFEVFVGYAFMPDNKFPPAIEGCVHGTAPSIGVQVGPSQSASVGIVFQARRRGARSSWCNVPGSVTTVAGETPLASFSYDLYKDGKTGFAGMAGTPGSNDWGLTYGATTTWIGKEFTRHRRRRRAC